MSTTLRELENERLLSFLRSCGIEVRSYDGWRSIGHQVRYGQRQKSYVVRDGNILRSCYGFHAEQVRSV